MYKKQILLVIKNDYFYYSIRDYDILILPLMNLNHLPWLKFHFHAKRKVKQFTIMPFPHILLPLGNYCRQQHSENYYITCY